MPATALSPRSFDAAVFDLDGTLVDTEVLCNATGVAACAALGHPVSLAFFEGLAGVHDVERARRIAVETGRTVDTTAFFAEWDRLCTIRFAEGIPLKAGAVDLLGALKSRGLPLGLCTSSRRGPALEKLRFAGLDRYFDVVVTVDDVARAKPAPDPYLAAAAALGVRPDRCVAFEDSETGAQSAHAAGMVVVQTPDLHPATGRYAHHVASRILEGARLAGLTAD